MNFNIDDNLISTATNFAWSLQEFNEDQKISDGLISEIAKSIIAASNIRPFIERQAQRTFSLVEISCLIIQDLDKKSANISTAEKIAQLSQEEKEILNSTFHRLSQDFIQLAPDDLKTMTLLFGAKKIEGIAKNVVIPASTQTEREKLENTLNKLRDMRSKFDIDRLPEAQRDFLRDLDAKIAQVRELLDRL